MKPISVVVCTYNRFKYFEQAIVPLLALEYPCQIVIVNDGSTDETRSYLDGLMDPRITIVHHEVNRGLSVARNSGIAVAIHDLIAFTDDDCVVDGNWLDELVKGFEDPNTGLVMGQTFYRAPGYVGYYPERLVRNLNAKWPMGCNVAYRKEVFDRLGGFDPTFFPYNNEDSEMAIRAVAAGYGYIRKPGAVVVHQKAVWTPRSLLRSARNASVWVLLKRLYPKHYRVFGPNVVGGWVVNPEDYLYILTLPIFLPILLLRYLLHGKSDLKMFFLKWPVYLFLRRYYIYREAIVSGTFMV